MTSEVLDLTRLRGLESGLIIYEDAVRTDSLEKVVDLFLLVTAEDFLGCVLIN